VVAHSEISSEVSFELSSMNDELDALFPEPSAEDEEKLLAAYDELVYSPPEETPEEREPPASPIPSAGTTPLVPREIHSAPGKSALRSPLNALRSE
jgi:hypothetical protein